MVYGGRCRADVNNRCQVPTNGEYPSGYSVDGDHLKYAVTNDGINWNANNTAPIMYQGKTENNPYRPEWQNRMDPTIIFWNNKYYMYYQLQIDETNGCTEPTCDSLTDSITYATSTDLQHWTKSNRLIVLNKPKTTALVHPKAVKMNNEVWLYFGIIDANGWQGTHVIKSTDPVNFDYSKRIITTGDGSYIDGSQHLILFPNDPGNQLHMVIGYKPGNGRIRIPIMVFSHDGIHWIMKPGGFPNSLNSTWNIFCNIGTDISNSLTPTSGNRYNTIYSCSTFDGVARDGQAGSVQYSDLSSGTIQFTVQGNTAEIPGDFDTDGHVNMSDYNLLISEFGTRYTIYDFNTLVTNFNK